MSALSLTLLAGFTLYFMAAAARTVAGAGVLGHAGMLAVNPGIVLGFAVLGIVFDVASLVGFRVWSSASASSHAAAAFADGGSGEGGGGGGGGGGVGHGGGGGAGEGEGDDEGEGKGGAGRDGGEDGGGEVGNGEADGSGVEVSRWRLRRGYSALYRGCGGTSITMCRFNVYSINMLSALLHVVSDLARSITTLVEGVLLHTHPELDGADVDAWSALVVCFLISLGLCGGAVKWSQEFRAHLREPSHGALVQRDERASETECSEVSDHVSSETPPLRAATPPPGAPGDGGDGGAVRSEVAERRGRDAQSPLLAIKVTREYKV